MKSNTENYKKEIPHRDCGMEKEKTLARLKRHQNNIINRDLGYAYIAIPKASNTSVRHGLLGTVGLNSDSFVNGVPVSKVIHRQDSGVFSYSNLSEIYKSRPRMVFTVVRNPWDRILSCYRDKIIYKFHEPFRVYDMSPEMSFSDFVRVVSGIPDQDAEVHFRSQCAQTFYKGMFLPTMVLRTETISKDWGIIQSYFSSSCNLNLPDIGRHAKRSHIGGDIDVTQNDIDIIASRYEKDVRFFGYDVPEGMKTYSIRYAGPN